MKRISEKEIIKACQDDTAKLGKNTLWECIASGMKAVAQAQLEADREEMRKVLRKVVEKMTKNKSGDNEVFVEFWLSQEDFQVLKKEVLG